jgi:uncharacterized DUF497 family protein
MRFEGDEQKNQVNIRKHGFSFADAWKIFELPMLVDLDDRFAMEKIAGLESVAYMSESLSLCIPNLMMKRFGAFRCERR